MALQVTQLKRNFKLDKGSGKVIDLGDPNQNLSPAEVMKFFAGSHPELTNGVIEGPVVQKDQAEYTIKTKAGKLG